MIEHLTGDLFDYLHTFDAVGHGVNCAGAMGRGIAREFQLRFRAMFTEYKRWCRAHQLKPGDVFYWKEEGIIPVFNLATQGHWKERASLQAIGKSVDQMLRIAEEQKIKRIGIPRIGASLGGLPWYDVERTLQDCVHDSDVTLVVVTLEGDG